MNILDNSIITFNSFCSTGAKVLEDMLNVHHHSNMSNNHSFVSTRLSDIQHESNQIHSYAQSMNDYSIQNRSISSSMHDNESSSSATDSSPKSSHMSSNSMNDDIQHVPTTGVVDIIRKEKKRERNRQAAQKCRTRKLTRIAELQNRVTELQDKNKDLTGLAECLKTDVSRLERQLEDHRTQGCSLLSNGSIV
jgi:chromosome segregation ATPase